MHETNTAVGGERGSVDDGTSVLLVDDDETWVTSTAEVLEHQREAFTVRTATDLATAKAAFEDVEPDCIVCDYDLGQGTGLDLLEAVRDRDADRPFILITGQGDESVASEAIGRRVTDYFPKRSLGGRNDRLARRIERAVDSYRTRRALARERQSKEAMLDILTATSSREGLVQRFCDHLVEERDYACAWIGTTDSSGGIVPQATAGDAAYLDDAIDPGTVPEGGTEPALVALARREPHAVAPIAPESSDGWRAVAAANGFGSAVAVPIGHEGTTFGVLAVYGTTTAVPPGERDLIEEYGSTIGYALRSVGWRQSLLSTAPVAVEVELTDESVPLVAVDRRLPSGSRLEVLTTVLREGSLLYVLRAEEVSAPVVCETSDADAVERVSTLGTNGDPRCEVVVAPPTPETVLADRGGQVVDATVANGRATVTAVGPDGSAVQSLIDAIRSEYPDAGIQSVRSTEEMGRRPTADAPFRSLTDKQRQAVELAFYSGYFERPRENNATEVAEKAGVSRQTFTQHLRSGERKLLAELLDPPDD